MTKGKAIRLLLSYSLGYALGCICTADFEGVIPPDRNNSYIIKTEGTTIKDINKELLPVVVYSVSLYILFAGGVNIEPQQDIAYFSSTKYGTAGGLYK